MKGNFDYSALQIENKDEIKEIEHLQKRLFLKITFQR